MVFDLVILEESHVPVVEPRGPGRRGVGDPQVEKTATARVESSFAPIGSFIPPAAAIPRVGRQREEAGAMASSPGKLSVRPARCRVHGRFQHRLVFAFAACGRDDGRLVAAPAPEAFLMEWASAGWALSSSQTSTTVSPARLPPMRTARADGCRAPNARRRRSGPGNDRR
jgi:hypothetical protein